MKTNIVKRICLYFLLMFLISIFFINQNMLINSSATDIFIDDTYGTNIRFFINRTPIIRIKTNVFKKAMFFESDIYSVSKNSTKPEGRVAIGVSEDDLVFVFVEELNYKCLSYPRNSNKICPLKLKKLNAFIRKENIVIDNSNIGFLIHDFFQINFPNDSGMVYIGNRQMLKEMNKINKWGDDKKNRAYINEWHRYMVEEYDSLKVYTTNDNKYQVVAYAWEYHFGRVRRWSIIVNENGTIEKITIKEIESGVGPYSKGY